MKTSTVTLNGWMIKFKELEMMDLLMVVGILVPFLIGAWSISSALFKWLKSFVSPKAVHTKQGATAQPKFVRVGRIDISQKDGIELTNWDDLPKYKGETGWCGLAKYRDVIVPEDYNCSTAIYMDTPVKQYFYDVMAWWKDCSKFIVNEGRVKTAFTWLAFPIVLSLISLKALAVATVFFIIMMLFAAFVFGPAGIRAGRQQIERTRNMSPESILQVGYELAEERHIAKYVRRKPRHLGAHHISASGYPRY